MAIAAGASALPITTNELEQQGADLALLVSNVSSPGQGRPAAKLYDLFAYPAQCNQTGMRYPLEWSTRIKNACTERNLQQHQERISLVLLDASAMLSTSAISLKAHRPDFVVMSFYKIFGYPTGIGALLVRKCLATCLKKSYFGGGTGGQIMATGAEL